MKGERLAVILVSILVAGALGGLGYYFRESLPPWALGVMVGAPLLGGLILLPFVGRKSQEATPPSPAKPAPEKETEEKPAPEPAPAGPEPEDYVRAFLSALQREGRFLDFLSENLEAYDDAQIGAAVRTIHRGLKAVVFEMVELQPVIEAKEGAEILVEEGFNPKEIRLIGNVKGKPPFKGVLRHPGWRAKRLTLPKPREDDVLAPAEVEIP